MGFFKRDKAPKEVEPVKEAQPNPQKQLDSTRKNMIKIKDALEEIKIEEIRKAISEEVVSDTELSIFERDIKMIKAVIGKQTASQLVLAESEEIDAELLYFAEHIQEEMISGHISAVNTYINAIKFGITKGHEPIKESDLQYKDEILKTRLEIVKHYKLISELHRKIALNRESVEGLNRKLETLQREYTECKNIAKKEKEIRPDLYEEIIRMSPQEITMAAPKTQAFSKIFSKVTELKSQIVDVKTKISEIDSNIQAQERAISTTENSLLALNSVTNEREREEIERINKLNIENMKRMQNEIFEFDELFSELDASIEAINSDPRLIEKMVRDMINYESIIEEDRQEEEAIRAGMKNYAEALDREIEDGEAGIKEDLEHPQQIEENKQKISN